MKLIIDISEDVYNDMIKLVKVDGDIDRLVDVAIVNGTPLTESDDCVNRAELLKALDTWDKFGVDDTGHLFRLDNLSYPHYEPYIHYRDVIKAVKGMPSVQPNREKHDEEVIKETVASIWGKPPYNDWIPVNERLPEESGEYLTTVKVKDTNKTFVDVSNLDADGIIKEWNWNESYKVIAWLPLPQPYKAESYESMLDKIRAEIEKECQPCIYEVDFAYKKGLSRTLEIIDKYGKGDKE